MSSRLCTLHFGTLCAPQGLLFFSIAVVLIFQPSPRKLHLHGLRLPVHYLCVDEPHTLSHIFDAPISGQLFLLIVPHSWDIWSNLVHPPRTHIRIGVHRIDECITVIVRGILPVPRLGIFERKGVPLINHFFEVFLSLFTEKPSFGENSVKDSETQESSKCLFGSVHDPLGAV
jgi:hypothetical protein